jgi:phosphoribosylglycinamide formyltransferase-1
MRRIAIFASGSGSNAQQIALFSLQENTHFKVVLIVSDNPTAYVVERAKQLNIPCRVLSRAEIGGDDGMALLRHYEVEFIVLAGYLGLVPSLLIQNFPRRILNLHPALLPNYGGKGMYGHHVHEAVIAHKEERSGITIHLIDEEYDRGTILCQVSCPVLGTDTPELLAERIHRLEHLYYPLVIEDFVQRSHP